MRIVSSVYLLSNVKKEEEDSHKEIDGKNDCDRPHAAIWWRRITTMIIINIIENR